MIIVGNRVLLRVYNNITFTGRRKSGLWDRCVKFRKKVKACVQHNITVIRTVL